MPEGQPSLLPAQPPRHVFVYGTLRRGGRNDITRLSPAPRYVGMGEVKGSLYRLDWYPGLALGGKDAIDVIGEVYEVPAGLELVLDGIEEVTDTSDSEYFKRVMPIEVRGAKVECFMYEINPERIRGMEAMGHGDWITFHGG